jgi:hypothetical protein
MVRANSPGYGPMGALRVERVTKSDGRYVLYYTWPDGPDSPAGRAGTGLARGASRRDRAPDAGGGSDKEPPERQIRTDSERRGSGV